MGLTAHTRERSKQQALGGLPPGQWPPHPGRAARDARAMAAPVSGVKVSTPRAAQRREGLAGHTRDLQHTTLLSDTADQTDP